jgi:hypothetical protein
LKVLLLLDQSFEKVFLRIAREKPLSAIGYQNLVLKAFRRLQRAPEKEDRLTQLYITCQTILDDYKAAASKELHADIIIDAIVLSMLANPTGASLDILEDIVRIMAVDSDDNLGTMVMMTSLLGWNAKW